MKLLILSCLSATALSQLITHPNGAVTPVDHANLAATANHLAVKGLGYWPYHHLGKREADPQLVHHFNGAVTPFHAANYYATVNHLAGKGLVYYGKREAEADPQLVHHFNGAVTPYHAANHLATVQHLASKGYPVYYGKREAEADPQFVYGAFPYVYGHHIVPALVAHPNGAVVPLEPADVVKARAEHLAAHAA